MSDVSHTNSVWVLVRLLEGCSDFSGSTSGSFVHCLCFSGCCTPKCRISGLLKVATNYFQEKGDECVHLTGTDFPHFMVLRMCQGSDESSGRKILLISKF